MTAPNQRGKKGAVAWQRKPRAPLPPPRRVPDQQECDTCVGEGYLIRSWPGQALAMGERLVCFECNGTGKQGAMPAPPPPPVSGSLTGRLRLPRPTPAQPDTIEQTFINMGIDPDTGEDVPDDGARDFKNCDRCAGVGVKKNGDLCLHCGGVGYIL